MMSLVKYLAIVTLLVLALSTLVPSQASAEFIENIYQSGSDVIASGSGTIDLDGLGYSGTAGLSPKSEIEDYGYAESVIFAGAKNNPIEGFQHQGSSAPFGNAYGGAFASTATGDFVGLTDYYLGHYPSGDYQMGLFLPLNYVSNSPLANTTTFDNATLESLGLAGGIHTYTWASDSFVVNVETLPSPAPLRRRYPCSARRSLGWRVSA